MSFHNPGSSGLSVSVFSLPVFTDTDRLLMGPVDLLVTLFDHPFQRTNDFSGTDQEMFSTKTKNSLSSFFTMPYAHV